MVTRPSGDRRSGKPLSSTFEAEAERLSAGRQACQPEVIRIKTDDAQLEMINQASATPLDMRLPRETRSGPRCRGRNRRWRKSHLNKDLTAPYLRVQTCWIRSILGADRELLSAEDFSGYKIGGPTVYMGRPPTFSNTSVNKKE